LRKPNYLSIRSIFKSFQNFHNWHALQTHGIQQLGWLESRRSKTSVDFLGNAIPWWTYSCTDYLNQVVRASAKIIEFGGGASTIFWLSRGNDVTTIENDEKWASKLSADVSKMSRSSEWNLLMMEKIEPREVMNVLGKNTFDVVVNDFSGDRNIIIDVLISICKDDGFIIWDNSDRVEYQTSIQKLLDSKFKKIDFFGLSPINAFACQTTIFNKNFPQPHGETELKFDLINY
jgi:hypothetical protein